MIARIANTNKAGLRTGAMLALAFATAGCTTFGGNVSGDFACRAPGGTCAPMTSIDVGAVAAVLGESATAANSATTMPSRLANVGGQDAEPTRTSERTLRIVFPAYVDAAGVLHDEATAHAVVEASGWVLAPSPASPASRSPSAALPSSEFSRSPAPSSLREAVAGASAPAIEGLEFSPAQAPHPIHGVDAPALPTTITPPSAAALAAARAGHRISRPGTDWQAPVPGRAPADAKPTPQPLPSVQRTKAEAAAARVREAAKPALSRLGTQPANEPNLDDVFGRATQAGSGPR